MQTSDGIVEAIGNTPLIKLKRASAATGCTILGKAEFMNPGQSVKDRAALHIIQDAEKRGAAAGPAALIVEGTAGNTGIGLALVANALGYRTRDRHSRDAEPGEEGHAAAVRRRAGRGAGGALRQPQQLREGRPAASPNELRKTEPNGAIWANQFDNIANRKAHYRDDRPGNLGADRRQGRRLHLRGRHRRHARRRRHGAQGAKKNDIAIGIADPMGAALYSYYTHGRAEGSRAPRSPKASARAASPRTSSTTPRSTSPIQIPDEEAVPIIFDLLEHEGLCLGGSTGINVAGAIRLAKELGPGPHHRHDPRATTARAISRSCSIRNSCAEEACPVPEWLERRTSVEGAVRTNLIPGYRIHESCHAHRLPVSRRFLSEGMQRHRGRARPSRRHRARPHRVLRRLRRPARRSRRAHDGNR